AGGIDDERPSTGRAREAVACEDRQDRGVTRERAAPARVEAHRTTHLAPRTSHWFSGCSAAWIAHLTGGQGVAGSNPAIPTIIFDKLWTQPNKPEPVVGTQ